MLRSRILIFNPTNSRKYAAMVEPNLKFLARGLPCTAIYVHSKKLKQKK